jgi:hypothetical protein
VRRISRITSAKVRISCSVKTDKVEEKPEEAVDIEQDLERSMNDKRSKKKAINDKR